MMSFALKYRSPIDAITADRELKLRKYELLDDDWKIIGDLVTVLEVSQHPITYMQANLFQQQYKSATVFFSSNTASIAAIIPAMDKLDTNANAQTKEPYHPSILAAMKFARKKLNHYYSLTDLSAVYRIAMGEFEQNVCYM